jgi:hypothetical protein
LQRGPLVGDLRIPRPIGEERGVVISAVHHSPLREAVDVRALCTRPASIRFHRGRSSRAVSTPPDRANEPESHRCTSCALRSCSRLFAACGSCDRGRRYCSRSCSVIARRSGVRRAGERYQGTERGRRLHAIRQARYRDRQARVTHHGRVASPRIPDPGAGPTSTAPQPHGSDRVRAATPREGPALPDCALCGRHADFLRGCFGREVRLRRSRRRTRRAHSRPARRTRKPLSPAPDDAPLRSPAPPPSKFSPKGPSPWQRLRR